MSRRSRDSTESRRGIIARFLAERNELRRAVEVTGVVLRGVARSDLPRMAAALSYRTIFSLIPVLVVGLVVAGSIVKPDQVRREVERLLQITGLSEIAVETDVEPSGARVAESEAGGDADGSRVAAETPGDAEIRGATDTSAAAGSDARADRLTDGQVRLDEWITDLVERVQDIRLEAIGLFGFLLLIWAAIGMLIELERAFDTICGSHRTRSWARRITTYWTTLTLGVLLLLATFAGGEQAGERVSKLLADADGPTWAGELVTPAINLCINAGLLILAYVTIPTTRIRFRSALVGAAVAGTLWEAAKALFRLYLEGGAFTKLYGALALLPLFLLWVYVTWVTVLLGLQIAYAMQHFDTWIERSARRGEIPVRVVDPASIVAVAACLARAFGRGEGVSLPAVAERTGVPTDATGRMLTTLENSGVAHRLAADDDDEERWSLAKPPSTIAVDGLLRAGDAMSTAFADDETGVTERLARERRAALGAATLAELIEKPAATTTSGGAPAHSVPTAESRENMADAVGRPA